MGEKTSTSNYSNGNIHSRRTSSGKSDNIFFYFDRADSPIKTKVQYRDGSRHGVIEQYEMDGTVITQTYWVDGEQTTRDEFRRYELIEQLSGLNDE